MAREFEDISHPTTSPDTEISGPEGGSLADYSESTKCIPDIGEHFNFPHIEATKAADEQHAAELEKLGPLARLSHARHDANMPGQAYSVGPDKTLHKAALGGGREAAIDRQTAIAARADRIAANVAAGLRTVFDSKQNRR